MAFDIKRALRSAVLRLLAPIVRMLIEAGVGVGELNLLVRIAYVRAAREMERERFGDAKPSVTRINVVTGIPRNEIPKLLAAGDAEFEAGPLGRQRAEQVLAGWHNDPDFHTRTGDPAALPFEGTSRSFTTLCERYNGDPRTAAVRDELLRVGAVRRRSDGTLEVLRRDYADVGWDPEGIAAAGEQLGEHAAALLHNLKHPADLRFIKRVVNVRLAERFLPGLRRDLEESGQVLANRIDNTLNDPAHTADPTTSKGVVKFGYNFYVILEPADPVSTQESAERAPEESKSRRTPRRAMSKERGRMKRR